MAQSVATVTANGSCTFGFKWLQVRIHKATLFFFHLSHVCYFFSSIPLLLVCISENENIGIITIHHERPCRIEISHPRGRKFNQGRGLPSPW